MTLIQMLTLANERERAHQLEMQALRTLVTLEREVSDAIGPWAPAPPALAPDVGDRDRGRGH